MARIVRRFYHDENMKVEASPPLAEYSAEMVLRDNGTIIEGSVEITKRKRYDDILTEQAVEPNSIFALPAQARGISHGAIEAELNFWKKEREGTKTLEQTAGN